MRLFKRPLGCLKEPYPSPIPEGSDDDYDYDDDREGAGGFYNLKFYIL